MRRVAGVAGVAAALLATPGAAATAGQGAGAFAGVPGVAARFYPVTGSDATTLRASIDLARPTNPQDGERVDALTHWRMTWRWPGRRRGGCDLARATLAFRATVLLPRLADAAALPPALAGEWRRYRAALDAHEAGHVRYAYAQRGSVLAAIRGATCATAERAARAALRRIVAHDIAYDRDTRHGMKQGATFPAACVPDAPGSQQSGCTSLPDAREDSIRTPA